MQKTFGYQNQQKYAAYLSPWIRIPPDPMDNMHKAIAAFSIPKSQLDQKTKAFLVVKDETKANVHAMPDIIVGGTEILDEPLKQILL